MELDWKKMLGVFVFAAVVTLLIINVTIPFAYDVGACSINQFECDYPDWSGECTDEIKNQCCMDVRMCGGDTDDPNSCYTQYCEATGEMCVPVYKVEGLYECQCKSAYV